MRRFALLAAPLFALGGLGLVACHSSDPYYVCDASMPNTTITSAWSLQGTGGWFYCQGVNDSYGGLCWEAHFDHRTRYIRSFNDPLCPI